LNKLRRKASKQFLWITLAAWTGMTFVGFFSPIRTLAGDLLHFRAGGWELFWIGFYGLATYGNAGYLREQVCKYMCPYARFQSAMFDHDTLVISYDAQRGEPRGPGKKRINDGVKLGDCVDCTLCVQVCPTGIDIRDGLQIDCIACGACIDACDQVMAKVGSPLGLIRYSTENAMAGRPTRVVRARTIIYGVLLLGIVSLLVLGLFARKPLLVDVLHDRNALYRVDSNGSIENSYTLKITNKAASERRFVIDLLAPAGLSIRTQLAPLSVLVPARSTGAYPVTVQRAPSSSDAAGQAANTPSATHTAIRFQVRDSAAAETVRIEESMFFAPEELLNATR
jgi:cytochrome c oxidase accessory protein FixG